MKLPFRKTPMQSFETTIASLAKRGEQLAVKRTAVQATLKKAKEARQQALLSADLDDQKTLNKLDTAVFTATTELAGIDDALAALAQQKAEAERQLTVERERIQRSTAADKMTKQIAAIEAALPGYIDHSRTLAEALSKIGHWHFESAQMTNFIQNASAQVEVAANFALAELKAMPNAIRDGSQAIPGEPRPVPVVTHEAPRETQTVFMLRSARYRDHDGRKQFAGQWEDAILPVETARRALDQGISTLVTDPRRAKFRGARGGDFDRQAPDVVDLDDTAEQNAVSHIEPDPVLRAANFTVIDRSARTIQIEVPRS
jgi:hypothetical protein